MRVCANSSVYVACMHVRVCSQERHPLGLYKDVGPPLAVPKRCKVLEDTRAPDMRSFMTSAGCDDLAVTLERCQYIPDAALARDGWKRLEDPSAERKSESTFWYNK